MSEKRSKQQSWEERYAGENYLFGTEPNDFLAEEAARLVPGQRALAVADGEGRNGVWLAGKGLDVLSVDFSANALVKARALAAERGLTIKTEQADLFAWDWPVAAFDLAVAFFIQPGRAQQRILFAAMLAALKPGGMLIFEAHAKAQAASEFGGPDNPDHLYSAATVREALAGVEAEIVILEEKTIIRRGGRHPGKPAAVVRLIARRSV
ncbi:MAG: SAM-dependent methyltransferase [Rhodospirillaceae bacterium]|jgi:SAM-dependent methyltransferase|nr:SAM-dependent methyltransferase [Rhodospirillaceae bacterium]MDP6254566.1 methyltransferase domain-containing protein [Alphaproteobacteria bacterium]MDP7459779.1 methyltransferase domain-containing protein [Alphaproteobacteria bacterium]MEE1554359.1 methyltransferase domain-containing protein [Alphaproteobacteria bacterium]HJM91982.1 methyltransferase domain-containing protein [Alphaproteobacteria bacterium]|tara:strand:+ start:354 stop:980 length:627 start_codon:yes stop_codon:yes gene_type:complete